MSNLIQSLYWLLDKTGIPKTDLGSYLMIALGILSLMGWLDEPSKNAIIEWLRDNLQGLFALGVGITGAGISDRLRNGRAVRAQKWS